MLIIGKNEESTLRICISNKGKFLMVPVSHSKLSDEDILDNLTGDSHGGEILENFTFTATLVPFKWIASRESGSIIFQDAHEPAFQYQMTQRNLFDLLRHIISGDVAVNRDLGGISSLFTFEGRGATLTILVYG